MMTVLIYISAIGSIIESTAVAIVVGLWLKDRWFPKKDDHEWWEPA